MCTFSRSVGVVDDGRYICELSAMVEANVVGELFGYRRVTEDDGYKVGDGADVSPVCAVFERVVSWGEAFERVAVVGPSDDDGSIIGGGGIASVFVFGHSARWGRVYDKDFDVVGGGYRPGGVGVYRPFIVCYVYNPGQ